MAYVTQAQIEALLPPAHLADMLDDDGDSIADEGLLDTIIAGADQEVDSALAGIYNVPFDPAPAIVSQAALCFVLERLYARRIVGDEKNPWQSKANAWRERLKLIGTGKAPLAANESRAVAAGGAIVEDARTMGDSVL